MYFDPIKEAIRKAYMPISEQEIKSVDIGQDAPGMAPDEGLTGAGDPGMAPPMDTDTGALPAEIPPAPMDDKPMDIPPELPKEDKLPKIKFGPTMKDVRGNIHDVSISVAKIIGQLEGKKILGPEDVFELKQSLEMANEKLTMVMDSTDDLRVK